MFLIKKNLQLTRKHLFLFLSFIGLCLVGFFLLHSRPLFKEYTRTIKENRKAAAYVQQFIAPVEMPVYLLDQSISDATLKQYVSRPFVFLGKGKQTEVYESLDGTVVLRCLAAKKKKKKEKAELLFRRVLLAWSEVREETGLLAVACTPQDAHLGTFSLLSRKGNMVQVDSEATAFFFQKKAIPLKRAFLEAMQTSSESVENLIASLFQLLSSFRTKGIIDLDGALIRNGNLGVIDGKVILLDVGKLERCRDKKFQTQRDILRLRPLYHWFLGFNQETAELFLKYQTAYKNQIEQTINKK